MNTSRRFWIWFFDLIGTRVEDKTYRGHGDFDIQTGWELPGGFRVYH